MKYLKHGQENCITKNTAGYKLKQLTNDIWSIAHFNLQNPYSHDCGTFSSLPASGLSWDRCDRAAVQFLLLQIIASPVCRLPLFLRMLNWIPTILVSARRMCCILLACLECLLPMSRNLRCYIKINETNCTVPSGQQDKMIHCLTPRGLRLQGYYFG